MAESMAMAKEMTKIYVQEAEEKSRKQAEERNRLMAELKAQEAKIQEAEKKSRKETEEKIRLMAKIQEAEEKSRKQAEEMTRIKVQEAEERAQKLSDKNKKKSKGSSNKIMSRLAAIVGFGDKLDEEGKRAIDQDIERGK